jgi:hypothetical protein
MEDMEKLIADLKVKFAYAKLKDHKNISTVRYRRQVVSDNSVQSFL